MRKNQNMESRHRWKLCDSITKVWRRKIASYTEFRFSESVIHSVATSGNRTNHILKITEIALACQVVVGVL